MKKIILLILFLFFLSNIAFSDSWITKTSMPTGRFQLSVTEVNGDIYAAGGNQFLGYWAYNVLSVVEKYNPNSDTWETSSSLPSARTLHASAGINSKIFFIGGNTLDNYSLSTVEVYDPLSDIWETKTPMPTARDGLVCVSVNNKIYAIGGQISANNSSDDKIRLDIVEVYDPLSDTWETKSPMPTVRSFLSAAAIGNKIYVIGGSSNNEGNLSVVEEYDIVTDSWQTRAPINIARSGLSCCALNGKIYIMGGQGINSVEEYNPLTNTWELKSPMSQKRMYLGCCSINGKIYAIGGHEGYDNANLTIVEEYTPDNGLVAHYPLDENLSDIVRNSDGVEVEGQSTFTAGAINNGIQLASTTDYRIEIEPYALGDSSFTVSGWVYIQDESSYFNNYWAPLITMQELDFSQGFMLNSNLENNQPHIGVTVVGEYDTGNFVNYQLEPNQLFGQWHLISATISRSDNIIKLYFDGQNVASEILTTGPLSPTKAFLGSYDYIVARNGHTRFMTPNIKLDDIRLYNRALSDAEIQALYTVYEQPVDNDPYFDNASLPSLVTIPDTIPFSGYVIDDVDLDEISMSVSGPAGTHTVFTEAISGLSRSLGDHYYFDSNNATYSGSAGNYTVTLTAKDSIGQETSKNFNVTVSDLPNVLTEIFSPISGAIDVVSTLEDCQMLNNEGKWCFNQHQTGFHHPGGGIGGSDDTYAWDINLNYPSFDSDANKPVYAIADGIIPQTYAGMINAGGSVGQLLIEHNYDSQIWWSGYLHLSDIQVEPGDIITQGDLVGFISNVGTTNNHLHFVVYNGENIQGGLNSFDSTIIDLYYTTIEKIGNSALGSWLDGSFGGENERISNIIQACINDRNFIYTDSKGTVWVDSNLNNEIYIITQTQDAPKIRVVESNQVISNFISPWYDSSWNNVIPTTLNSHHFNTVWGGTPNDTFEVISFVDELAPLCGTSNEAAYFFTYDTKYDNEQNDNELVTFPEWISYLSDIKKYYGRSIDTLTIFAHGEPGKVLMSQAFQFQDDQYTQTWLEVLKWNPHTGDGILSKNSTILLFSCNVAKEEEGQTFIKNLSNWTGATVYANSVYTGDEADVIKPNGDRIISDWELDVIGIPDNFKFEDEISQNIKANIDSTILLPGGIKIEITKGTLNKDGQFTINNIIESLDEYDVNSQNINMLGAYDLSFEDCQINPDETITVTLPYNSDLLNYSHSSLSVLCWNESSQEWSDVGISDTQVIHTNNLIVFKTNHTSIFAVIENPTDESMENGNDGGGGSGGGGCFVDTLRY